MVLKRLFRNSLKNLNSQLFKAKLSPNIYPANIYSIPPERNPMLVLIWSGVPCAFQIPVLSLLFLTGISGPLQNFLISLQTPSCYSFPCLGLRVCPTQFVNKLWPAICYFISCILLHSHIYALSTQLNYCFMKVETLPFVSVFPTMSGIVLCTS